MAQRRLETIATSLAPACRCSQESLPGWSVSKSWCACLTVATFRPRLINTGITLVTSVVLPEPLQQDDTGQDRKSTRLNSSHQIISYAVFCLKKKKNPQTHTPSTHPHTHQLTTPT